VSPRNCLLFHVFTVVIPKIYSLKPLILNYATILQNFYFSFHRFSTSSAYYINSISRHRAGNKNSTLLPHIKCSHYFAFRILPLSGGTIRLDSVVLIMMIYITSGCSSTCYSSKFSLSFCSCFALSPTWGESKMTTVFPAIWTASGEVCLDG